MDTTHLITLTKMSKKARKEFYARQRTAWNINPVTRRLANPRAYNRSKAKREFEKSNSYYFSGDLSYSLKGGRAYA